MLTNEGSFIYTQYIYDQYDESLDSLYYDTADAVKEEITIAEYIDGLYADLGEEAAANPINAIKVRGVAFCDIDDDGIYEMILYLSFLGSHFVVFDQDNGKTFEAWKSSIMVGDVEFYAPSR